MVRVIKKGFRELDGVQLILEEGNDLGSRWGWKASQVSDIAMYLSGNLRIANLLKHAVCVRRQKRKGKKDSTCQLGRRGVCILTNLPCFSSSVRYYMSYPGDIN